MEFLDPSTSNRCAGRSSSQKNKTPSGPYCAREGVCIHGAPRGPRPLGDSGGQGHDVMVMHGESPTGCGAFGLDLDDEAVRCLER